MSSENFNQNEDASASGDGAAGAGGEDLQDALGEGENGYVTDDPSSKKPSPILGLVLALALAGGGYYWYTHSGPSSAEAAEPDVDAASQTVTKFLDGGTKNVAVMEKMLRDTEKVVQQFLNYPSMTQVPLADLQTNPFRFRALADDDSKPSESDAAAKKRREEERQAVLKAVANLNLQSVIHSGTRKSCMINNTLYTEGQQVDSFVIEKINAGAVIVKSGVYRFELRMQK